MYGYKFFFIYNFFSLVISLNTHRYLKKTFHEFKVLKKVFKTEMFNVEFHNKFIKFGYFVFLSS